jgi:hypothetical protein
MPHSNIVEGKSEREIWTAITDQLRLKDDDLDYSAQFTLHDCCITIDIDFHPESGNEQGNHTTSITAQLPEQVSFRFRVEKQDFKHEIQKLFGMQHVVVGNQEFDKQYLVQSNDEEKVRELLSDDEVCDILLQQPVTVFEIRERKVGAVRDQILDLDIEDRISEPEKLKELFRAFNSVLCAVI